MPCSTSNIEASDCAGRRRYAASLAVVVVTGWTDPAARARLVHARVEAVLLKPADPAEFVGLLREVCADQARARGVWRPESVPTDQVLEQARRLTGGPSRDTPRQS